MKKSRRPRGDVGALTQNVSNRIQPLMLFTITIYLINSPSTCASHKTHDLYAADDSFTRRHFSKNTPGITR